MKVYLSKDTASLLGPTARQCQNVSLWADKFPIMQEDPKDNQARKAFVEQLCRSRADDNGRLYRIRFLNELLPRGRSTKGFRARLSGRLIVNQAGGVVENAGLCLDRHFGVPYTPGSALKGIARAAALEAAREGDADLRAVLAVFGWTPNDKLFAEIAAGVDPEAPASSFAGLVSFLPAYPLEQAKLGGDIVTCHYPNYYKTGGQQPARDTESPIPNPFPVVEEGVEFLFTIALVASPDRSTCVKRCLALPDEFEPLVFAEEVLIRALTDHGLGAKTAAGYGWFHYDRAAAERLKQEEAERQRAAEQEGRRRAEEERRLVSMSPFERARETISKLDNEGFAHLARTLGEHTEDERHAFLDLLRKERADRWKVWNKKKPELASAIRAVAEKLGEVLP